MSTSTTNCDDNIRFYDHLAPYYPLFFRDFEGSMEEEGRWLTEKIGEPPADVLDACCGSGRQAIPLAGRGFRVVGADPSAAMLAQAGRLATEHSVRLDLHQVSFNELALTFSGRFDWVVAMGNGICHHVDASAIGQALAALRACLRPSGKCIIGTKDFERVRRERNRIHRHGELEINGQTLSLFDIWEFQDPILISTAYLKGAKAEGGGQKVGTTREYMLGAEELEELALQAGFRQVTGLRHSCEAAYELS